MTTAPRSLAIDSVYFLMYDGWKHEMQSNRWHFAVRWARHVPVVLVQPNQLQALSPNRAEPDPRIRNCVILPIRATAEETYAEDLMIQVGQVHDHMMRAGHRRPLLWFYNPRLAGLYAALPSPARVYHATENYFHFTGLSEFFFRELRAAVAISDIVVAVSNGVASSLRTETGREDIAVVTNGCDRAFYLGEGMDEELSVLRGTFERVAVYAGNINSRIDFDLVVAVADAHPTTLLAFYGPVAPLDPSAEKQWKRLLKRKNVAHLGAVPVSQLPGIYRSSDLGFIPYKQERRLVENGFPLKALEMSATSLPVVTSLMKPLVGLAEAIVVTHDSAEFVEAFGGIDRGRISADARAELDAVCSANDYDAKFDVIRGLVDEAVGTSRTRLPTRLDETFAMLGDAPWLEVCRANWLNAAVAPWPLFGPLGTPRRRSAAAAVVRFPLRQTVTVVRFPLRRTWGALGERMPDHVRARIPRRLRDALRRIAVG